MVYQSKICDMHLMHTLRALTSRNLVHSQTSWMSARSDVLWTFVNFWNRKILCFCAMNGESHSNGSNIRTSNMTNPYDFWPIFIFNCLTRQNIFWNAIFNEKQKKRPKIASWKIGTINFRSHLNVWDSNIECMWFWSSNKNFSILNNLLLGLPLCWYGEFRSLWLDDFDFSKSNL